MWSYFHGHTTVLQERNQLQLRSYTRNVKFIRIYIHKMGLLTVAIGLPCIMDAWKGHREPRSGEMLDRAREFDVCVENMHG